MAERNISDDGRKDALPVELGSKVKGQRQISTDATEVPISEHEREILQEQVKVLETKTSYITLYRYATRLHLVIMIFSGL